MLRNSLKLILASAIFAISATGSYAQTTTKKKKKKSILTKATEVVSSVTGGSVPLTESEIAQGLKEALNVGAKNASSQLSAADGFFKNSLVKIPFPSEAQIVKDKLVKLGFTKEVDEFELTLNRAAESASKDAANIFGNAITSMTITDAKNILQGNDSSATHYLHGKTNDQLKTAFKPIIEKALASTMATSKWTQLTTLYNKVPFVKPVNTDLVGYTNDKAMLGLFKVVAQEEGKIRKDPAARVSEILKKVFGSK